MKQQDEWGIHSTGTYGKHAQKKKTGRASPVFPVLLWAELRQHQPCKLRKFYLSKICTRTPLSSMHFRRLWRTSLEPARSLPPSSRIKESNQYYSYITYVRVFNCQLWENEKDVEEAHHFFCVCTKESCVSCFNFATKDILVSTCVAIELSHTVVNSQARNLLKHENLIGSKYDSFF